jgi:hypothetical protein
MNTITHIVENHTLSTTWAAFLAGASVFDARLPASTQGISGDPQTAFAEIMAAIASAAEVCRVEREEVVPAGYTVEINPHRLSVLFGSGRTGIRFVFTDRGGHDHKARIEIGLHLRPEELADLDGAYESTAQRYQAVIRKLAQG